MIGRLVPGSKGARLGRLVAVGLVMVLGGLSACTSDDALEGKPCDLSAPREKQCVAGYVCRCEPEGCFCRREQSMSAAALRPLAGGPTAEHAIERSTDPNWRFLQRHLGRIDQR